MADPFTIAVIAAATAITAGTAVQTVGALDQAKAEKRAARIKAQRERIRATRDARVQRAEALTAAEAQGIQGGATESGAVSSVGSQLGSNIAFANEVNEINRKIASARSTQALGSGISQLGASTLNIAGTVGK